MGIEEFASGLNNSPPPLLLVKKKKKSRQCICMNEFVCLRLSCGCHGSCECSLPSLWWLISFSSLSGSFTSQITSCTGKLTIFHCHALQVSGKDNRGSSILWCGIRSHIHRRCASDRIVGMSWNHGQDIITEICVTSVNWMHIFFLNEGWKWASASGGECRKIFPFYSEDIDWGSSGVTGLNIMVYDLAFFFLSQPAVSSLILYLYFQFL